MDIRAKIDKEFDRQRIDEERAAYYQDELAKIRKKLEYIKFLADGQQRLES